MLGMSKTLTTKEYNRMSDEYDKVKFMCKCGHKVIIPKWVDKQICSWCGQYVFKDEKEEFKYRIQEKMNKN